MLYNVFMLVLTIVGVVGIVVYSYKMSRTPVYPVGIVRKPQETRPVVPSMAEKSLVVTEPKPVVTHELETSYWRDDMYYFLAKPEMTKLSHQDLEPNNILFVDDVPESVWSDMSGGGWWTCPNCKSVQKYEKEARCVQCSFALGPDTNVIIGLETTKESALHSQLSQHHQALREMDKRIRELEKESVAKKIAEVAREEEKRQDWLQ